MISDDFTINPFFENVLRSVLNRIHVQYQFFLHLKSYVKQLKTDPNNNGKNSFK